MNTYIVKWQTKPSPGSTFYRGRETVHANSWQVAADIAINRISKNMLFPKSHIKIQSVTQKA